MRMESVQYFSEKEEELVNLLIDIGMKKNIAKLLVFLTNVPEASSRTIERGTDLRQPEVSIAMKHLADHGWIRKREKSSENKGRVVKIYELAVPIAEIMNFIAGEKKKEAKTQLTLIKKLRDHIS